MIRIKVSGMTCGHCEGAVRKALGAVEGVTEVVEVDREESLAVVDGTARAAALVEAIQEEGYEAEVMP